MISLGKPPVDPRTGEPCCLPADAGVEASELDVRLRVLLTEYEADEGDGGGPTR